VRGDGGDLADASRDHAIWEEAGLLTVAGGKLTTFRLMARDALARLSPRFPELLPRDFASEAPPLVPQLPPGFPVPAPAAMRLLARYGEDGLLAITSGAAQDLEPIPGLGALRSELRWCARAEGVRHLDDLLLRRVRIGLTVPRGGLDYLRAIRGIVEDELGWCDSRWREEVGRYREIWERDHAVPLPDPDVPSRACERALSATM
jgi:glycerol-3-phosphate dehydrogenase